MVFEFQPQVTSKFCFPTKSSVPFTIHEDDHAALKKINVNVPEKNVENQKPLLLQNEIKVTYYL